MQKIETHRGHWTIALCILLSLANASAADDFEIRRAKLLEM